MTNTQSRPLRVILVRHGESLANLNFRLYAEKPDHKIELSPLGHEQAKQVGQFLAQYLKQNPAKNIRLWVSPYARTQQTAAPIAKALEAAGIAFSRRDNPLLVEMQMGLLSGLPRDQWTQFYPDEAAHFQKQVQAQGLFYARPPLGESPLDVLMRLKPVFADLHRHYAEDDIDTVIIVGHGMTHRVFINQWLNAPLADFEADDYLKNCQAKMLSGGRGFGAKDEGILFTPTASAQPNRGPEPPHIVSPKP